MKGIDIPIEQLNNILNEYLWVDKGYVAYGRVFPNVSKEGIKPEIMIEGTRQYVEKLPDSSTAGHSFVYVRPEREVLNGSQTARVGIYFTVNLEKLYPEVKERATEYAHQDAINEIKSSDFKITGIVTGVDAFRDFAYVSQHLDDMQPFYLFRIDAEIVYNTNC